MSETNVPSLDGCPQGQVRSVSERSSQSTGGAQTTMSREGRLPTPGRVTFREAVEAAMEQVEFQAVRWPNPRLAYDMCRIMAEIYMMRPEGQVRIGDEIQEVYLVQEVFRELRQQHLETVIRAYMQVEKTVCAKKAYLRTALYNAVFEEAASGLEEVKQDRRMSVL